MDTAERERSFANSIGSIYLDRTFPLRIFRESWTAFFFLESDMIFVPAFIGVVRGLMGTENSQICCLINLGATVQKDYGDPPAIYLDKSIEPSQYTSLLLGDGSWTAWLYLVDRYVCASDVGEWCIYCEKENDVAVIAFRSESGPNKFAAALQALQATSIRFASQTPREGAFRFDKLTPAWRSSLVAQYSG